MKKILQRLLSSKKKRIIFCAVALCAAGLLYLAISLISVSQAELSLENLRLSFRDDIICHEACTHEREGFMIVLAKELVDHPRSKACKRLQELISNPQEEFGLRISLLRIVRAGLGPDKTPDYLKELMAGDNDPALRAAILNLFGAAALSAEAEAVDYYLKIIAGNEEMIVRLAAVRALSSLDDKSGLLNEGQMELIKKLIFDSGTDKRLRRPLILLLGDYYPLFPDETGAVLSTFYKTESSGDAISRAFTADILNRLNDAGLTVPEISQEEWDEYYND